MEDAVLVSPRGHCSTHSLPNQSADVMIPQGDHKSDFAAYPSLVDRYRLLSFDFRGHGQSSQTKPYNFGQIVDDIEVLRQRFGGDEQCIICGGSFGGFLARQYAITYPSKVTHLILRGTAPSYHRKTALYATRILCRVVFLHCGRS